MNLKILFYLNNKAFKNKLFNLKKINIQNHVIYIKRNMKFKISMI